jgi:hypothetical protein
VSAQDSVKLSGYEGGIETLIDDLGHLRERGRGGRERGREREGRVQDIQREIREREGDLTAFDLRHIVIVIH